MPVEDPEPFSGRFVQIFLHQDLSTYLRQKSLNLGLRVGVLLAGKSASHQYKKYFIHENRNIAMKKPVKNTAANYGRYSEKYQYSQPSTDVHL